MPLTGIHNENEFYSHHYLAEIFAGDIQATIEGWRNEAEAGGGRTPWAELRALAPEHMRFRRDFERERNAGKRILRQREWFRLLLAALGYPYRPTNLVLEDGVEVPVLCAIGALHQARSGERNAQAPGGAGGTPRLLVLGAFDATGEGEDPLTLKPHPLQFSIRGAGAFALPAEGSGEAPPSKAVLNETWNAIVTRRLFFPGASSSRAPSEGTFAPAKPPHRPRRLHRRTATRPPPCVILPPDDGNRRENKSLDSENGGSNLTNSTEGGPA